MPLLAEQLRADEVKGLFAARVIEADERLERSRVIVHRMSANALDSDGAHLEGDMSRLRDPLNKERLLLPSASATAPLKAPLRSFLALIDFCGLTSNSVTSSQAFQQWKFPPTLQNLTNENLCAMQT